MAEAVEKLGGPTAAAYHAKVTTNAVYRWLRQGRVGQAAPCILLSEASGVSARRLAGLGD